jgi:hypothetical protein
MSSITSVRDIKMQRKAWVVVCFSLYQKKSLLYKECETFIEIYDSIKKCIEKDAHIICIRQFLRQ